MSSESEDEQLDLNVLDFNDPMVIQTLRMTMMEIMENEHTEKPVQQSRSRTMLRGTHTIRSMSYPYRRHSKSRVDTTRGRTLPMLEEQPEEELRQMGEPLLGNYLLDYARRRVYTCLSTSIVRNNYFIFKQAMHKDLRLNDRSADKLRRIWDEARIEYHKRLIRENTSVTPKSQKQTRVTGLRQATAGHMQSRIPTLRSRGNQAKMRTKPVKTRTSIVDVTVKSPTQKPHPTTGSRILARNDRVESDFRYVEKKPVRKYKGPKAATPTKRKTTGTSVGVEKANLSSSPEPGQINSEVSKQKDDNVTSDISQGLTALQLNEPAAGGSGIQTDQEKYVEEEDGSTDSMESLYLSPQVKPKRKSAKKSASSSSISTDQDIRYVKQDNLESSDSRNTAEKLKELFRGKQQPSEHLLRPPIKVTSKPVQDLEEKESGLLYLEDIYHYPRSPKKSLTPEQYEKRVQEARRGRQLRQYMQEMEKHRKIYQQRVIYERNLYPRQTTTKQTPKQGQIHFPQARLFLGEIEYPKPFERYNVNVNQPHITPCYIGTCEFCQMLFYGQPPSTQVAPQSPTYQNTDETPKQRRTVEPDPFLVSSARRQRRRKQLEEEQRQKAIAQRERARERAARKLYEEQQKRDYWARLEAKQSVGTRPANVEAVGFQTRQLSPTEEFNRLSEAEGVTHMVSPPRSIMRPSWFPERMPYHHQPHHIQIPTSGPMFRVTRANDELMSSDEGDDK